MVKSFFYHVCRCFYLFLKFSNGPFDDQLGRADANEYLFDLCECGEEKVSLTFWNLGSCVGPESLTTPGRHLAFEWGEYLSQAFYKSDPDKKDHWIWIKKITFCDMIQTYEDQITTCSIWSREKNIDHH